MTPNERLYDKLYRYLIKVDGYQPFGFDWPTLRLTHPQIAAKMWEILQDDKHQRLTQWQTN